MPKKSTGTIEGGITIRPSVGGRKRMPKPKSRPKSTGPIKPGEIKRMKQESYMKMTKKAMRLKDKINRKGIKFNMTRAVAAQRRMNYRDHRLSDYKPAGSTYRPLGKLMKAAGKIGGKAMGIAQPVKAMTDITRKHQYKKRIKSLGMLTGQKYKEM